jgi:hypothetical protein
LRGLGLGIMFPRVPEIDLAENVLALQGRPHFPKDVPFHAAVTTKQCDLFPSQ